MDAASTRILNWFSHPGVYGHLEAALGSRSEQQRLGRYFRLVVVLAFPREDATGKVAFIGQKAFQRIDEGCQGFG